MPGITPRARSRFRSRLTRIAGRSSSGTAMRPRTVQSTSRRLHDRPRVAAAVGVALQRTLAFQSGLLVERSIQLLVGIAEDLAAPAQNRAGRREHVVEREPRRNPAV